MRVDDQSRILPFCLLLFCLLPLRHINLFAVAVVVRLVQPGWEDAVQNSAKMLVGSSETAP
jgi:hypothetical protein